MSRTQISNPRQTGTVKETNSYVGHEAVKAVTFAGCGLRVAGCGLRVASCVPDLHDRFLQDGPAQPGNCALVSDFANLSASFTTFFLFPARTFESTAARK